MHVTTFPKERLSKAIDGAIKTRAINPYGIFCPTTKNAWLKKSQFSMVQLFTYIVVLLLPLALFLQPFLFFVFCRTEIIQKSKSRTFIMESLRGGGAEATGGSSLDGLKQE